MIRKLRLKFVAVCMALVTVVLAAVLAAISFSVAQTIENLSRQVLHRVIQENVVSSGSRAPEASIDIGGDRLLLPYFTVNIWGTTAYVTAGTYSNLENTQALEEILNDCLSQNSAEGTVDAYHMRYLRQDNGLYQRVAFVDMSMEQAMLRRMMSSYILIALAALILLLGVSMVLSRWVTRPVEKAWRQQRQFLSDASHELKTPLTVILSNAQLLGGAGLEEKPARWADNILSESRQMKSLVEQMLTLARADNMAPAPPLTAVSLSDTAVDCALAFEPVAFEAGKSLSYHLAESIEVLGDREKLSHLISILLDNAIKYSSPEAVITLSLEKADRHARLTVSNPGKPIPAAQLERLFERFYRADASRGETSGFGLGLSIAATIAAEHKGTLKAYSDNTSTRFVFSLPLKK